MKIVLFFCLLTIVYCFDECTNSTYKSTGGYCSSKENQFCKIFNVCKNNKCKEAKIGDACEVDTDCYLSYGTEQSIICVNKKCSKRRYNGETCEFNEQASRFESLIKKCFNNKCTRNVCEGLKKGEVCDPKALVQCDAGLFCSQSTKACISQIEEDQDCHFHVDNTIRDPQLLPEGSNFMVMCKGGLMCLGTDKVRKCKRFRGGIVGTYCDYSLNRHYECEFGLQCDRQKGECVEHGGSNFPCKGDRNCLSNEECVCQDDSTGKCTAISGSNTDCGFHKTAQDWVACSKKYNCPLDSKNTFHTWLVDIFSPETCMGKYCRDIPRNTLCCSLRNQDANMYSEYELKEIESYCKSGESDLLSVLLLLALFGTIVGIVVLIMVTVAVLKIAFQKRKYAELK